MARLPFVQVDTDFITHGAAALAAVLGPDVSPAVAGWAVLQLRTWALSRADDADGLGFIPGEHAPRLVATFAGWRGDPAALVAAMCDPAVGLAEVRPDGIQLLGLDRDVAAVRKSRGDRERMSRRRRGDVDGKTQTQTQKEEEKPSAATLRESTAPPLVLSVQEAEKPKRAPNTGALGEFIDWAREVTKPLLPADAVDPGAGMKQHERVRLGEAVKAHGLEALKAGFRLFMGWQPARDKGYSVGFFANQWEGWVRQAKAAPSAQAEAPKPKMRVL